ncbi:MAG: hypothetical protein LBR83_02315 [Clostridiales bacterium]|jgi:hypothetical protein|nr:hypothetical protein [Clostridiales bacterium]
MSNDRIRVATSKPSLKSKLKTNLSGTTDIIYWYIRFNIPLDETTVSDKTMEVTDTEGYIMRTDITYRQKNNIIVISPLDTYEQNRFYLLNISKKVQSSRGQNLRSTIHILFKLLDNQISDYKILKKDVTIPKPKPRPKDYDKQQSSRKPNNFDMEYMDRSPRDRMTTVSFRINLWLGVLGLLMVLAGVFLQLIWLMIVSVLVCAGGVVHVYFQMKNDELRSVWSFNRGVRHFNKARYKEAGALFRKAVDANPENELAKYGLYKISLYK